MIQKSLRVLQIFLKLKTLKQRRALWTNLAGAEHFRETYADFGCRRAWFMKKT